MTSCMLWTGSVGTSGYGVYYKGKYKVGYAHRKAYEDNKGVIPKGLFICHSCDVPLCININHLFLGTALDNNLDKVKKGRHVKRPKLMVCKKGHNKPLGKSCKTCYNEWARMNYDPLKERNKKHKQKEKQWQI